MWSQICMTISEKVTKFGKISHFILKFLWLSQNIWTLENKLWFIKLEIDVLLCRNHVTLNIHGFLLTSNNNSDVFYDWPLDHFLLFYPIFFIKGMSCRARYCRRNVPSLLSTPIIRTVSIFDVLKALDD